ncbi:hypothetical protein LSAT2_025075 [Lamellibrachia satsuma]|nr:hypothetical protein LSAT2_025075 [Lamellibrachia satsuma]
MSSPKSDPAPIPNKSDAETDQTEDAEHPHNDRNTPSTYCPPPKGISEAMWERFQLLRERKQKLTREQHAQHRTRKRKQKKESDGDKVTHDNVQHDSTQSPSVDTHLLTKQQSPHNTRVSMDATDQDQDPRLSWVNVKPYLGVNDHLNGVDQGRHAAKTKLEEKIDEAISLQEFDTAEKLSDHLATREFGKEVAAAFSAKRYAEKKTKEDDMIKARKKKKLDWGFDHKQRWETKGNM